MLAVVPTALDRGPAADRPRLIPDHWYRALLAVSMAAILLGIILLKGQGAGAFWAMPGLLLYTFFVTTFELSRILAAMLYKPMLQSVVALAPTEPYEPTASFVIPCKNEEASIEHTIRMCFGAYYPGEKLEVIVVNDGSTDGTLPVLRRLQQEFPRLTVVDWPVNRGKRQAMGEGFRLAIGEIVVQLDSDSYIDPITFPKLIEPFRNPRIGAVCAHADPQNAEENQLTRMQAAYYFVSFRILKAAESTFLAVFCCSGCSSAYRRSVVLPILDEWLQERFLGLPVTWGDDRALTNWVLRRDYKTIYTDEARAYTIVPNRLRKFLKQQVRWKKGWFVNSVFATRFILRKEPFVTLTYFFPLILVTLATPIMATKALIYNPLVRGISPFYYIFGVFLIACTVTIYYRWLSRGNRYWPYVFLWSALNMVILSFILFYALATIQNRKWGTR